MKKRPIDVAMNADRPLFLFRPWHFSKFIGRGTQKEK